LVNRLPVTGEIVRGSLIERVVRHNRGCTIWAGRGGHPMWVLTIGYAGGRTRQFSLRGEQVDQVRRWLGNYHNLKQAIEAICELNHGCEGRISVVKRRHGLARSRYQGDEGIKRWVIADNLVNLGRTLAKPPALKPNSRTK
jgi:hypothetical protein